MALVFTIAAVAVAPDRATAQPAQLAAGADAATDPAALYKEGVELYSKNKWKEAKAKFQEAWRLNPTGDVAYNLGSTEYQLHEYRNAAEHLSFALRHWPLLTVMVKLKPIAKQRFDESRAFVAALTVKVNVPNAAVFVDGRSVGKEPLEAEVFVEPGKHTVEAKLDGYAGAKETVDTTRVSALAVSLTLSALQPAPTAATSVAPAPSVTASAGAVPVAPPSTASSVASAPPIMEVPHGRRKTGIIIAGGATAGAVLVAGVVFTVVANGKANAARDKNDQIIRTMGAGTCAQPNGACGEAASLFHDRQGFSNAAAWSFIAAGAFGAATAIYAVATKPAPKTRMRAGPLLTADSGGLMIGGEW
jgi:PEGA domain